MSAPTVYAAIPGGGSLLSKDISRMRRALVAGFIVTVGGGINWRATEGVDGAFIVPS